MRTRQDRRRSEAAAKTKAVRQHPHIEGDSVAIGKFAKSPTMCSCEACGNPRRTRRGAEKLTLQERKAEVAR